METKLSVSEVIVWEPSLKKHLKVALPFHPNLYNLRFTGLLGYFEGSPNPFVGNSTRAQKRRTTRFLLKAKNVCVSMVTPCGYQKAWKNGSDALKVFFALTACSKK